MIITYVDKLCDYILNTYCKRFESFLTKGWDLSESGKQKPITHFLLKIQILNREWLGHLPMNNWNRKSTPKIRSRLCEPNVFPFIGKWLHHSRFKIWILSKKWVHGFCLPDSLKSFPLAAFILQSKSTRKRQY